MLTVKPSTRIYVVDVRTAMSIYYSKNSYLHDVHNVVHREQPGEQSAVAAAVVAAVAAAVFAVAGGIPDLSGSQRPCFLHCWQPRFAFARSLGVAAQTLVG